jgi:hypothetical protein
MKSVYYFSVTVASDKSVNSFQRYYTRYITEQHAVMILANLIENAGFTKEMMADIAETHGSILLESYQHRRVFLAAEAYYRSRPWYERLYRFLTKRLNNGLTS